MRPNITAQSLPLPFITTQNVYKYVDIQKRHLDTSHSITHILEYPTYVSFINLFPPNPRSSFFSDPTPHKNPSPRTGPQDLLVTHYDFEKNEQKTLHKYAINQITQCESEHKK